MAIGKTPTEVQLNITKSTDCILSFKCTDANGDPFDITPYEYYFVVRDNKTDYSTQRIEILNDDISKSDSGGGTTDTFTIDITNSLSDITQRIYYYEIRSKKTSGGNNEVWFNGTFNVQWTVQEAR